MNTTQRRGPAPAKAQPGECDAATRDIRGRRILIVDDHPLTRSGLAQLINREPDLAVCCEAPEAADALKHAARETPDLVITDITMPGRGGLELIKDLVCLYPKLPVLVISMHDEMIHANRVLRAGARGYVMKEAGAECILAAIRKVLEGGVYVSDSVMGEMMDRFQGRTAGLVSSPVQRLSDREFATFELIGQGKTTKEIAAELNVSVKTVDAYCAQIRRKLNLNGTTALMRYSACWQAEEKVRPAAGLPSGRTIITAKQIP